jgi:hypothetical protein
MQSIYQQWNYRVTKKVISAYNVSLYPYGAAFDSQIRPSAGELP